MLESPTHCHDSCIVSLKCVLRLLCLTCTDIPGMISWPRVKPASGVMAFMAQELITLQRYPELLFMQQPWNV